MDIHDVELAFEKKLGAEGDASGDHKYFYLEHAGSQYTVGKLSHSWRGSLSNTQIGMLAKRLLLQKREFEGFVDCSMTAADTLSTWEQRRKERLGY